MPKAKVEDHFQSLFDYAPISLWEEDFSAIKGHFDDLRARGVTDFERYLAEHPDETEACIRRIRVLRVNRRTLEMFAARSEKELLDNLDKVFRDEMRQHFRAELLALWRGEMNWGGRELHSQGRAT